MNKFHQKHKSSIKFIVEKCGENEVYTNCGSSCGDLTCERPSFAAVSCLAVCVRGCFCAEGFVRGPDNVCIPVEKCPPSKNKLKRFKIN